MVSVRRKLSTKRPPREQAHFAWPAVLARWSGPCLRQPCHITRHQVDFEVDLVADGQRTQLGDLQRVRDDEHRKRVTSNLVDSKRDPIERDRALRCDETAQSRWSL